MSQESIKNQARELLEQLPDSVTWRELAYEFYVRAEVESGLRDCAEGRTNSLEAVFANFGITDDK